MDAIDPDPERGGDKKHRLVGYAPIKAVSIVSGNLIRQRKEQGRSGTGSSAIFPMDTWGRRGGVVKGTMNSLDGGFKNGKTLLSHYGIPFIQAARDGLLEVVRAYIDSGHVQINDMDEYGYTALHYAARYNQVEVMKALVEAGADVNIKQGQDDVRPLHLAARYNNDLALYCLLEKRAIINIKDLKGRTPLHYATRKGHEKIIKMLISVSSCNVNEPDADQTTPLIMAALQGNSVICETLISRGADIERKDINEMTALMWAAAEGHTQVAKVLLKAAQRHGAQHEILYIRAYDKEGNTALHLAVQNGSLEVVNLLLSHGADVNCEKKTVTTPLSVAAANGFLDIAKVLVYNGAVINCCDIDQITPIHKAALYNKVDILEFLVKRGGNLNARDKNKMTPLHCGCWKGQTEAVQFLLSNGAQIAESDIFLKNALHWAVQFGHSDTLLLLLQHGGKNLVTYTDKNDQTALHYAAFTGNVSVLKTLLDIGARPDAKDQEERAPLHIAAQYGNWSCVEALIQASNHETNDDDVDGRTPLLLACINGHERAVEVLLQMGSDVSRRDDEHCTALMLAASEGHTAVMKILLENQAGVNDVNKMKNTALHCACLGGHMDAVQMLLEFKADVTLTNTYEYLPIDLAIDNMHHDCVNVILKERRTCLTVMGSRGPETRTVLDKLIAKMPESALIVLDHCLERSSRDDDDKNLTMHFDYQFIDPGPGTLGPQGNRYFALNTMVEHERDGLLSHPLCQNILSQKWVRFGRTIFYLNLLSYLGYLTCLSMFAFNELPDLLHFENGCAIILNETERELKHSGDDADRQKIDDIRKRQPRPEKAVTTADEKFKIYVILLYFFVGLFVLRDVTKIISQKWKYLFNVYNAIVWILIISTLLFILHDFEVTTCLTHWRAGWIAMFLACINLIMYLRRIDLLGIYVIMFVTVLGSLLKVVLVFLMFSFAFGGCFFILMQHIESKMHLTNYKDLTEDLPVLQDSNMLTQVFADFGTLMLNVVVMTLGEIEFVDLFMKSDLDPFTIDIRIQLLIFLFLMPIVLMNLMIGVAVGDIEKIQHNAYLKRIGLQVDLMYNIENNMPVFVQKRVHVKRATVRPNEGTTSVWHNISSFLFGSSRKVQFIDAGSKDKVTARLDNLTEKLRTQNQTIRIMMGTIQQQYIMLRQVAEKLEVNVTPGPGGHLGEGTVTPGGCLDPGASASSYEGGLGTGMDRGIRRKSVHQRHDRPRSTIV